MSSVRKVVQRATKLVTPSPTESRKLEAVVTKVNSLLKDAFERGNLLTPQIALGGSYARGTWLRGTLDVDFFLLYPPDYPREKIESDAIDAAKLALKGYEINMRFAEHPYVEAFVNGTRVNVVPCYNVKPGEWRSAADRSPYHTEYIKSRMNEQLKLEARLLKKFVRAAGVYGAEVKIQGLSGYVCEVLTLKFGSFEATLEKLAKLNENEVISIEEYDRDLASSFKSPVIILDPVDTTRNLGTAISARNVAKLVLLTRQFVSKPELSYFRSTQPTVRIRQAKAKEPLLSRTVVVSFKNNRRSPDILWGQLRKSVGVISNKLNTSGFHVLRATAASDEKSNSAFIFLVSDERIGRLHLREGPEYFRGKEVANFYSKNRRKAVLMWIGEGGRVESLFERDEESTSVSNALGTLLSKKINSVGLSDDIRREIAKGFRISTGKSTLREGLKKQDWLATKIRSIVSEE